ncbi:MAG: flagellar biosynthetic protein FliO [Planctomycetes bacterium]|nr:flagellar biosynthetic protein FliO [Planctomycetota bacterium]
MKLERHHWISLATAGLGILAAFLATPLLFPAGEPTVARATTRAAKTETGNGAADERALAQLGIAIVGILATGGTAIFVIKKTKNLNFRLRARGKSMEVIDVLNLGNKKSIAAARVYDRVLILGIAEGNVSLLCEMNDQDAAAENKLTGGAPAADLFDKQPQATFRGFLQSLTKNGISGRNDREIKPAPRRAPLAKPVAAAVDSFANEDVDELL